MRIDLAPRDIGRILDDALVLYRDNFRTLMLAALAVLLPPVLLFSVSAGTTYAITFGQILNNLSQVGTGGVPYAQSSDAVLFTGLLQIVAYTMVPVRFVANVWLSSSVHRSTPEWMVGHRSNVREFLVAGRARVLQLGVARFILSIINTIAYYIAVFVGVTVAFLAFALLAATSGIVGVVLGVIVAVVVAIGAFLAYMLAMSPFQPWGPAVVLEDTGIGPGLTRSLALVRGNTWRTVGFWMTVWMVAYAFRAAIYGPAVLILANWLGPVVQDPTTAAAALPLWIAILLGVSAGIGEIFAMPFERACWTQYYLELRARNEGMDLIMRARELAAART